MYGYQHITGRPPGYGVCTIQPITSRLTGEGVDDDFPVGLFYVAWQLELGISLTWEIRSCSGFASMYFGNGLGDTATNKRSTSRASPKDGVPISKVGPHCVRNNSNVPHQHEKC